MTAPATDVEATVLCEHLSAWRLHDFATRPSYAVREERTHGSAGGGWIIMGSGRGIRYEYSPGYGRPATVSGLVPWSRVTELTRAAVTAELLTALGEAIEARQALGFLAVKEMWARQVDPPDPSPIADPAAHNREVNRLHWLIHDLGEQIKQRIRNPYPLGQAALFDLEAA